MNEGFVAIEQPVPAGQQVALEPALALMLAQHLHDPPGGREKFVVRRPLRASHCRLVASNTASSPFDSVSSGPKMRKLRCSRSALRHRAEIGPAHAYRRCRATPGVARCTRVVAKIRHPQIAQQHARHWRSDSRPCAVRRSARVRQAQASGGRLIEQFLRTVAAQPVFELLQVLRDLWPDRSWHLMGRERCLRSAGRRPLFGPVQPLGELQHDHRPARALAELPLYALRPLNLADLLDRRVERSRPWPRASASARGPRRNTASSRSRAAAAPAPRG